MGEDIPDEREDIELSKWYRVDFIGYETIFEYDCAQPEHERGCCCLIGSLINDYYKFQRECKCGGIMCVDWEQRIINVKGTWDTCSACMAANPDCKRCVPPGYP